ncbi:MAG: GNAT family N-acetyltransferase [Clostridiales bacterium]|jgi:ribosomal-protein-alanine N-acetyltransferase|nr:GNAT family N-acetyltransferase [Clostridiales bacterium]
MNIETIRLLLKNYTSDDFKYYWLLKSSYKVWQYSTFTPYQNEGEASLEFKKILDSLNENPYQFAALWTKEGNQFIGEAGIISLNQQSNRCVLGYNLLPAYWNMGFATEITKALVIHAFEHLCVERIEALTMSLNIASRKVLEKSGFLLEGTLRHFAKVHDNYFDVCYYSIITSDFL